MTMQKPLCKLECGVKRHWGACPDAPSEARKEIGVGAKSTSKQPIGKSSTSKPSLRGGVGTDRTGVDTHPDATGAVFMKPWQDLIPGCRCKCGHTWISGDMSKKPQRCPKCMSRTWLKGG